jgi:predicted ATPase
MLSCKNTLLFNNSPAVADINKIWDRTGLPECAGVEMIPLSKIVVRNFKSLRDVKIELGQLNVFIGENGVGKSNILEAIGMLSTALSGAMGYSGLAERGVRLSTPEVFKSSFKYSKRPQEIRIDATLRDKVKYGVTLLPDQKGDRQQFFYKNEVIEWEQTRLAGRSHNGATIRGNTVKKPSAKASIVLSAISAGAISEEIEELLTQISDYAIYSPSTPILRGVANDGSKQAHLGLYGGSLALALQSLTTENYATVAKSIKQLFGWVKAIETKFPENTLQSQFIHTANRVVAFKDDYMKTNFNTLYAYDVSEGVLYALFVLCLLVHQKSPKLFSLDNIDSTLNPGLVSALIMKISEHLDSIPDKQLLLTSHNPTTLDGLDLFNEKHRLFVVARGEDGSTKVRRIVPPEGVDRKKWRSLTKNMKLSELWLSGSIGALHKG